MGNEKNQLNCFFVSDLHGNIERYKKLFLLIIEEQPDALFLGGDLLPSPLMTLTSKSYYFHDFISSFLTIELKKIKDKLGNSYPDIFLILGNDDGKMDEEIILNFEKEKIWTYCHNRHLVWKNFDVFGYNYVPPSPFRLKDWERYDVSRYVDPGCIAPMDGDLSVPVSEYELEYATIADDLNKMTANLDLSRSIFLFHSPPYKCKLDRAALDGKMIDYAPLDVHVGSIAIQRFIEEKQPLITLHGHIHESTKITGAWRDKFVYTESFNAAHEGSELSLIRFNPYFPQNAIRELI